MTDEINRVKAYLEARNALHAIGGNLINSFLNGNGDVTELTVSDLEAVLARLDEITGLVQSWQNAAGAAIASGEPAPDAPSPQALANFHAASNALMAWPADTADELAPCPFCGGEAREQPNGWRGERPTWHEVRCDACDFSGPAFDTAEEAIAAWNKRAVPK
jgi:Lar family restriction alleviation protein